MSTIPTAELCLIKRIVVTVNADKQNRSCFGMTCLM